jgi:hypothetical protein
MGLKNLSNAELKQIYYAWSNFFIFFSYILCRNDFQCNAENKHAKVKIMHLNYIIMHKRFYYYYFWM